MWNQVKIEKTRVRLIKEIVGIYDKDDGVLYYERVISKGDYYYFQTITKKPTFAILVSFPLLITSNSHILSERAVRMSTDPRPLRRAA